MVVIQNHRFRDAIAKHLGSQGITATATAEDKLAVDRPRNEIAGLVFSYLSKKRQARRAHYMDITFMFKVYETE